MLLVNSPRDTGDIPATTLVSALLVLVLNTKTPENEGHRNEERGRSRIQNDLDGSFLTGIPTSRSRGQRYGGVASSPNCGHHVGNQSGEARIDVRPVCDP